MDRNQRLKQIVKHHKCKATKWDHCKNCKITKECEILCEEAVENDKLNFDEILYNYAANILKIEKWKNMKG
jgi:hypothetical protein